nr:alpha/beta hydrolase [Arthrobacter globiformis]
MSLSESTGRESEKASRIDVIFPRTSRGLLLDFAEASAADIGLTLDGGFTTVQFRWPIPQPYGTQAFAADAVAVLDAAGVGKAHVYGHSMGGRVAQWMAVDFSSIAP